MRWLVFLGESLPLALLGLGGLNGLRFRLSTKRVISFLERGFIPQNTPFGTIRTRPTPIQSQLPFDVRFWASDFKRVSPVDIAQW